MQQIEGYYLGSRDDISTHGLAIIRCKKEMICFFKTLDLKRKLKSVTPGTLIRITGPDYMPYDPYTIHKTGKCEVYETYRVEIDPSNICKLSKKLKEWLIPTNASLEDLL